MNNKSASYRCAEEAIRNACLVISDLLIGSLVALSQTTQSGALPSWNDGVVKNAILNFVARATTLGSANFVPLDRRIAVFDNDGTLWTEKPIYTQFAFALDRVKQLAPQHPEWKNKQPFQAVLEGDMKTLAASGERGMVELTMASHAGMTTDEFANIVNQWMITARHPRFHRPYTACVYQPMLELLSYLRANGFEIYIVSGGGVEFMRPWAKRVYGIPPQNVIGSSIKTEFQVRAGEPVLLRLPQVDFVDDKQGKPVAINKFIGLRPIVAFGNSDGDQQMLEWAASGKGDRLIVVIHHTDAVREYAYDRDSDVGTLDKALDEANARHWIVVDMKRDWKTIFPNDTPRAAPWQSLEQVCSLL